MNENPSPVAGRRSPVYNNRMSSPPITVMPLLGMILIVLIAQLAVGRSIRNSSTAGVIDYKLTPDGRYTVYRAIREVDGASELYSVATAGGTPVRLNATLAVGRAVGEYQISADGHWVVYLAPQDHPDRPELYSVPVTGASGNIARLSDTQTLKGKVLQFQISPDSKRVAYVVSHAIEGTHELYSVAIEGPAAGGIKLSDLADLNGQVFDGQYQISQEED